MNMNVIEYENGTLYVYRYSYYHETVEYPSLQIW